MLDVGRDGVPVIAAVDAYDLPNWQAGSATPHTRHAVTIVGYDNTANPPTYTYIDTCGRSCNNRGGNGYGQLHVISQAQMVLSLQNCGGLRVRVVETPDSIRRANPARCRPPPRSDERSPCPRNDSRARVEWRTLVLSTGGFPGPSSGRAGHIPHIAHLQAGRGAGRAAMRRTRRGSLDADGR